MVKRAGLHEPVAYLVGRTEFYSIEFEVTSDCLIPRPETEHARAAGHRVPADSGAARQLVCDLCTGCGIIAVAIAKNVPDAKVIATDISAPALAVATKNIEKHKLQERIELRQGDLFEPLIPPLDQFDLIACNPPYVSAAEYETLDKNVKDYEPRIALYAGEGGLDVYRRIAEKVGPFLKPDGILLLEIGYTQGPAVRELLEQTGVFASHRGREGFPEARPRRRGRSGDSESVLAETRALSSAVGRYTEAQARSAIRLTDVSEKTYVEAVSCQ